jgi:cytochrome c-type biogenesis protein
VTALGPIALALFAGMVSFTSPCCLPLMPGYLAYVGGVAEDAAEGATAVAVRRRVVGAALLFVAGFAIVFTLLGVGFSIAGGALIRNRLLLERIGGAFVIVMGLATMGVLRIPLLYREARIDLRRIRSGPVGALPLGMAFAFGWTPCVGPVLAGILTAASSTQSALGGGSLLFVYSIGLGIPFVLLALGHAWASRAFGWLKRHGRAVELVGGAILVLMGVLLITGRWTRLFIPVLRWFAKSGWPPI